MNYKKIKARKRRKNCHICKPHKYMGNSLKGANVDKERERLKLQAEREEVGLI